MLKRTKGYEGLHNLEDFDAFDTVDPLAADLPPAARVLPAGATYDSIGLPSTAEISRKQLKELIDAKSRTRSDAGDVDSQLPSEASQQHV